MPTTPIDPLPAVAWNLHDPHYFGWGCFPIIAFALLTLGGCSLAVTHREGLPVDGPVIAVTALLVALPTLVALFILPGRIHSRHACSVCWATVHPKARECPACHRPLVPPPGPS